MIDQEERRESCQQRGQVTNECMQFQFTINQLPVTFHGLYSEQPRSLHKVFLFPIHTFASVLQNILLIKTFLDQRPGNEGGKLGSNTDRRYAEAEATHGLESSDVTKTSASRVPKLNATRHDATRRRDSPMIYLKKGATPEKNVCYTDSKTLPKHVMKYYKKKYIT